MLEGKKLTVTTGSMNRLSNLRRSLHTWLQLPEPDHVVVVDWGSSNPVAEALSGFQDPRLIVVDALGQSKWHHSKCHNLEFQLACILGCELVLRLDNDCLVQPNFFERHPIAGGTFYAVNCHEVPPEADDKRNLCGTLFAHTRDFFRAGGYNERLVHYGYEDEDLYLRMKSSGLEWLNCDLSTLDHIPHDDLTRFENLAIDLRKFRDVSKLKQYLIAKNRIGSTSKPWTSADLPTQWVIERAPRHWRCIEQRS